MTRQKRQPEGRRRPKKKTKPGLLSLAVAAAGRTIARHPSLAGGGAAFFVAFSFVTANAIWYQPGGHPAPIYSTRTAFKPRPPAMPEEPVQVADTTPRPTAPRETAPAETAGRNPGEADPQTVEDILKTVPTRRVASTTITPEDRETQTASIPSQPQGSASGAGRAGEENAAERQRRIVGAVQRELERLGLYEGEVDGLDGPKTRAALASFAERAGGGGAVAPDATTLARLRLANVDAIARPVSRPAAEEAATRDLPVRNAAVRSEYTSPPEPIPGVASTVTAGYGTNAPAALVRQIQQGLSNIAYADVAVDGIAGTETRAAIRAFEKHYSMPETGKPSAELLAKLKEIGAL